MQDLVDATSEPTRSEQGDASSERDPLPELLELLGCSHLVAPASASARAGISAATRDDSELRLRRERAYPYGDPLAQDAVARPPRRRQAAPEQASESAPRNHAGKGAHAASPYQVNRKIAANDEPGSYANDAAAASRLLRQPGVPRSVALTIAGVAGSILAATLAALGYYALSASNTTAQERAVAANVVEEKKTSSASQVTYGQERNERGASASWNDQPKKVRTVTFRADVGDANTSAVESAVNARAELNAAAMPRAYPNADGRTGGGAASPSAPAPLDSRSELNASPAARAGRNVDDRETARPSAARPQAPARNGGIACQTSAGRGGYWAWRIIDGRKCWYEGKVGMSKDNLRWVRAAQ
jgi:hypothetical protein